jgi:hypothetical protein
MTCLWWWVGRERATTKATATATTKYRDLSTAAAKYAAFGRDDVSLVVGWKRTGNGKSKCKCNDKCKCNGNGNGNGP